MRPQFGQWGIIFSARASLKVAGSDFHVAAGADVAVQLGDDVALACQDTVIAVQQAFLHFGGQAGPDSFEFLDLSLPR